MSESVILSGSLRVHENTWLFRDISLSLHDEGWTCLLGPSGVGKTTVLRLLAGLETHGDFTGSIRTGSGSSMPKCAYMAQQDLLFPWLNVLENVKLGARLRGEPVNADKAIEIISMVGLSNHSHKRPRELSGGMRQRVALARTLMEERDLVLLDEPFSALDARTRAEMQELAHELLQHRTVLLVTHDPGEAARLGDKIYILNEQGLEQVEAKKQAQIAPADGDETMRRQSFLLRQLRERVS